MTAIVASDSNTNDNRNQQTAQPKLQQHPKQQQRRQKSGYPFQHSGESIGLVNHFQLRVTTDKIRFLCLSPLRPNRG
jgi:hypothetical protein